MQAVLFNVARAVKPGGFYGVLVGNVKKDGRFYHLPSRVVALAPDEIHFEVIKQQFRYASAQKIYSGKFIAIEHESLLVFRRGSDGSMFAMSAVTLEQAQTSHR